MPERGRRSTLANGHGDTGALVLVNYSNLVFTSVCSVLPIAIVTSVFPVLSAADGADFDRTSAGSTRAVMLMSWLGTAVIAAVALPAAHVLARQPDQVAQLTQAFLLYAPGVAGFALITAMSRVMFALGRLQGGGHRPGGGPAAAGRRSRFRWCCWRRPGWWSRRSRSARTVALLAVAVPMVFAVRRLRGPAAIAGLGHATLAGLAAGRHRERGRRRGLRWRCRPAGSWPRPRSARWRRCSPSSPSACWAYALDRGDLRMVAGRLRRFASVGGR